jgi:hypothetical protein
MIKINDSGSKGDLPFISEIIWVIGILVVFLAIGSIEDSRLPLLLDTWWDEVMHVDPAANLYFGQGFKSSAWFAQSKDEFFAGYPPLYPFLLYLWMRLFGFSHSVAQSMSDVLLVFSALILWIATIRLSMIASALWRIFLVSLVLIIFGFDFLPRPGRPDILMAALALIAVLAYSIKTEYLRYLALAGICAIFPFSGIALVAYTVIFSGLVLIYLKRSFFKEFLAIITGLAIGSLGLCGFYYAHGVWRGFLASILTSPSLSLPDSKVTFLDKLLLNLSKVSEDIVMADYKWLLISILAIVIYKFIKRDFKFHSLASFGLVSSLSIPFLMRTAGSYTYYYNWMACLPVAVCICSESSRILRVNRGWTRLLLMLWLTYTLLFLPPLKLIAFLGYWRSLDYSVVEAFANKNVIKDDWVVGDPLTYFALKPRVKVFFHPFYARAMSNEEKKRISVIILLAHPRTQIDCVFPADFDSITSCYLGGSWSDTGQSLTLKSYKSLSLDEDFELRVYRRNKEVNLKKTLGNVTK